MNKNEKLSYPAAVFFIVCFSMVMVSCSGWSGSQSKVKKNVNNETKVTIIDIAENDLGQVLIFGESENGSSVFMKNFYKAGKSPKAIHTESQKYVKSILRLKGKNVTIRYRKNNMGDQEILDVK